MLGGARRGLAESSWIAGRVIQDPFEGALFYLHDNTPIDIKQLGDQRLVNRDKVSGGGNFC